MCEARVTAELTPTGRETSRSDISVIKLFYFRISFYHLFFLLISFSSDDRGPLAWARLRLWFDASAKQNVEQEEEKRNVNKTLKWTVEL